MCSGGGDYGDLHIEDIAQPWCPVKSIATADLAVAALLEDGGVVCWGDEFEGGDCQAVQRQLTRPGRSVTQIAGCSRGFCAVLSDGSVVTWGDIAGRATDVVEVKGAGSGFVALTADGRVVCIGSEGHELPSRLRNLRNVVQLEATEKAFAVRLSDGSVVAWGHREFGGDCSNIGADWLTGIVQIVAATAAFAALC